MAFFRSILTKTFNCNLAEHESFELHSSILLGLISMMHPNLIRLPHTFIELPIPKNSISSKQDIMLHITTFDII